MELFRGTVYDFSIKSTLRGCWGKMMNDALCVGTKREKSYFCSFLRRLQRFFPCGECKEHFREYLIAYPPEISNDMFEYVVNFMNSVSARIGQTLRNPNILRKLFTDNNAHQELVVPGGDYDFQMIDKSRGCWLKVFCDAIYTDILDSEYQNIYFCKCLRRMQMFSPYQEELSQFFSINPPESIIVEGDSFFDYVVTMVNWCLARDSDNESSLNVYNPDLLWVFFTVEGKNTCYDTCDGTASFIGYTTAKIKKLRDHVRRDTQ